MDPVKQKKYGESIIAVRTFIYLEFGGQAAVRKAKARSKGYTSVLGRIIEGTLSEPELPGTYLKYLLLQKMF